MLFVRKSEMNLNNLKYESLSFARELQKTGSEVSDPQGVILRMQIVRAGDAICSLYQDEQVSGAYILENEEKAINEARYWIFMLYSAHCISVQVYKALKSSADHLLNSVSEMMSRNETEY